MSHINIYSNLRNHASYFRRIKEHEEEIKVLFNQYGIERIGPAMVSTVIGSMTIGPTEGALIALGALVVLGSIIGVVCICISWKT